MLKYLNKIPNDYEDQLNVGVMNKEFDKDLIELLVDSFRGLEILPNIKILGYTWEPEEDKYDANDHIIRRNVNKKKAIKNIAETRCGVLYIDIEVSGPDKTGAKKVHYIKKPIVVPLQDERGYYRIKGKDYFLIYQMVDKMMYPSIGAVTIKSLMPICVKTVKEEITDTNDTTYTIPIYNIQIFKSAINILLLYSHITITKTLNFMEVNRFIKILNKEDYTPDHDKSLYFECGKKSDIVVEVLKDPFEKFIYVKSVVGCLVKLFEDTKIPFKDIDDWEAWMMIVGGNNTIRRGMYQHVFFNRLLDDVTRKELKINDYDKQTIYYLLRWIVQNYHVLWEKDNLSLINKRLRCNEYVGSLMTAEISKKINRLVALGDRATIKEYLSAFKFPEDIFVSKMYGSGILRYNETNNDMDLHSKFRFTKSGPNSLGGKSQKRIPVRQRLLHPSMLGYIDISSTSSSEPGQGGDLSPYNDMKSLYFDETLAENEMHFRIKEYLDANPLEGEWEELVIKCDNTEQYNSILDSLYHYGDGKIKIYGTSAEDTEIIVMDDPRLKYRKFNEEFITDENKNDL